MELVCKKENLIRGLQIVETAISTRTTLPVLSNFLMETEDKKIKLISTNLEIGVQCYIEGKIISSGSVTIPAKRFINIIKELPDGENIQIKIDEKTQIDIKCGKSHFLLMGMPKEDYPILPEFKEEKAVSIDTETIKGMIKKTIFAVSTDETRYALTGIYFIIEDGKITFVSTNGRMLAYIWRGGINEKTSRHAIIPAKTINELIHILSLEDGSNPDMKLQIAENQMSFKVKDITLISRLIDETFPNYEQVIPRNNEIKVTINKKNLLSATKQVFLLTQDKGGAVKFSFNKNLLRLSASVQGIGSGEVDLDLDFAGPEFEIAFNAGYVVEILKNMSEENVVFEMNGALDSTLIRAAGDTDGNYLCVISPMRI